jgi:hypothetical protein
MREMRHKHQMPMQTAVAAAADLALPEQYMCAWLHAVRLLEQTAEAPPGYRVSFDRRVRWFASFNVGGERQRAEFHRPIWHAAKHLASAGEKRAYAPLKFARPLRRQARAALPGARKPHHQATEIRRDRDPEFSTSED